MPRTIVKNQASDIIVKGDTIIDHKGQHWTFDHVSKPPGGPSEGKLVVTDKFQRHHEFYPSVFDLNIMLGATVKVTVRAGTKVIELDADDETLIVVEVNGGPFVGVDFARIEGDDPLSPDGAPRVVIGHWPDGEQWERLTEKGLT